MPSIIFVYFTCTRANVLQYYYSLTLAVQLGLEQLNQIQAERSITEYTLKAYQTLLPNKGVFPQANNNCLEKQTKLLSCQYDLSQTRVNHSALCTHNDDDTIIIISNYNIYIYILRMCTFYCLYLAPAILFR